MAFVMSEHNVVQKITLNIGNFLGCEKAEDVQLTFRESTYLETLGLKKSLSDGGENALAEEISKIFPSILVEHDIYKTKDTLATNEEVRDLIFSKTDLADYVAGEYFKMVFSSQLSKTEEK